MVKETVTRKMLWECPNCGAPRVNEETVCKFCGSALVSKTVTMEEMTKESVNRQFVIENSYPTIVSELVPAWISDSQRLPLLLTAGILLLGLLLMWYNMPTDHFLIFDVLMLSVIVICALAAVIPVLKYKHFLKTAKEYEASVVSVDKRLVPSYSSERVEYTTMTVLFQYDGEKVFGLFRVSDKITRGSYGKGQKVKIRVKDDNIALSED